MRNRIWLMLGIVLGALVATVIVSASVTTLEREHLVYTRFVRVEDLSEVTPAYPENPQAEEFARRFSGDDPIEIMGKVRDTVTCVEADPPTEDPTALLETADSGEGLVCTGLASIYRAALEANGFEARIVVLARFLTDPYDMHTTIEVKEGRRWVIYDPTFGITFERDGRRVGAQDIKVAFLEGGVELIEPTLQDESAAYPAVLDDYYMDWRPLFSNVVVRQPAPGMWAKLPIVRWFLGEKRYYEVVDGHSGSNVRFLNSWYLGSALLYPLTVLVLSAIALWLALYLLRTRSREERTDA